MDDSECKVCGATNALLFECPHCERAFCADHQVPNHACDGLSTGATRREPLDEWIPAGELDAVNASGDAAPEPKTAVTELSESGSSVVTNDAAVSYPEPEGTLPSVGATALFEADDRDAARETRPDTERRWPVPDVRGLPNERRETLEEWFRRQTIVGYALKVATLAALFHAAFFAGLAATLYGII